jgi:glycosyltransferase involved in cell wall biosynthesis
MKVLVWQWGRFGGGPRFAALLADGLSGVPGIAVALSLASGAEIMRGAAPPRCDLPVDTYDGLAGFLRRAAAAPFSVGGLARRIEKFRPDIAVCALAGPLDLLMAAALRRLGVPFVVLVHDADAHPGDGMPLQMWLQRRLCRHAMTVASLSSHVGERLLAQRLAGTPGRPLLRLRHPPMPYDVPPRRAGPRRAGADGTVRLLAFGRLLPYKGLDLLADGLRRLGPRAELVVRVVGCGPESPELAALRALPGVTVENRWVPEGEVGALLGWCDAVVLPYREASQSGVAAAALAAHRHVIATNVGGLAEQLAGETLAILCEPAAGSLADGLRRMLDRPQAAEGAAGCPATASPLAAWQELGRKLADQLEALLRSGERQGQTGPFIGRALPGWSD